jgi:hypothetical protein
MTIGKIYDNINPGSIFKGLEIAPLKLRNFDVVDCRIDSNGNVLTFLTREAISYGYYAVEIYTAQEIIVVSMTKKGILNWTAVIPRHYVNCYKAFGRTIKINKDYIHILMTESINRITNTQVYRKVDLSNGMVFNAQTPVEKLKKLNGTPFIFHNDGTYSIVGMKQKERVLKKYKPE